MNKLIFTFFLLGLSFGVGPCLASCGPLLISYIAGTQKNILKSILTYILFSLSRIFIYLVLGLFIFLSGKIITNYVLGAFSRYFFILGGFFIIIIGLLIALGKNPNYKFCQKIQSIFLKKDTKTIIVLGLVIGILPCAPLISVVSYIGLTARHWLNSLIYSFSFGLGTIVSPLFLLVIFAGFIPQIIKNNNFYRIFNFICGFIIIFLGIQLIRRAF